MNRARTSTCNALDAEEMRRFRWDKISMVFQGAMNALNPVATIGSQLDDVFLVHRPEMNRAERRAAVVELLEIVKVGGERYAPIPTSSPAACASGS